MTQTVKKNKYADDVAPSDDITQLLEDFGFFASGFLPGQFEATKTAVRKFLDEGDAPDTAVHKAVSQHAPSAAKKRFKADQMGQRVGGNYQAIDHDNGFFSIMGIPIFAEVPAGAKRNKERIGEEWMDKAIEQNRMRRKEGHLPPVHIYHSDETAVKPSYAGKFVITHRGTITYEGTEIPALFANITDIPAEVFERIKTGVLPYRSVEVHDWDNPEIDSLALMDTDVPFFRMAMTTIGSIKKGKSPIGFKHISTIPSPLYWFSEQEKGAMICFRFDDRKGGANMATDISTTKPGNTSKTGLQKKPAGSPSSKSTDGLTDQASGSSGGIGPNSGTDTDEQPGMTGLDDGVGGVDSNTADGGGDDPQVKMDDGMGGPAPMPAQDPMQQILAMLTQLCTKMGCGPAAPAAPPPPPEAPSQDLTPVSGMRAATVERIMLKAIMPLQMEVRTLKAENQKIKNQANIKALVAKAEQDLEGWPIDEEIRAQLFKAATGGYIEDIVDTIKRSQPVDPPDSPAAFEQMLSESEEGGEVAKFMAEHPGPKANEWVRAQAKEHAAWVAQSGSAITFKEWLEANKYGEKIALTSIARPARR